MTPAERAIATYTDRARFVAAEIDRVPRPRGLGPALDAARHVVELPCGAGHFLPEYVRAGIRVTLIDANRAMLHVATARATLAGTTFTAHVALLPTLPPLSDADLLVLPNAALNQLACHGDPAALFAALAAAAPGARLLAQVLDTRPDTASPVGWYDPTLCSGTWIADLVLDERVHAGAARRRRRQHQTGDRVTIDFDYLNDAGRSLHQASVQVRLVDPADWLAHTAAVQARHAVCEPGAGGLLELHAELPGARGTR